jgi:antitoxin PrlF
MDVSLTVAENGRVVLPMALRRQLGLERGGTLLVEVSDDAIVLQTKRQRARRAQRLAQAFLKGYTGSLVDELSADRREEARRDNEDA